MTLRSKLLVSSNTKLFWRRAASGGLVLGLLICPASFADESRENSGKPLPTFKQHVGDDPQLPPPPFEGEGPANFSRRMERNSFQRRGSGEEFYRRRNSPRDMDGADNPDNEDMPPRPPRPAMGRGMYGGSMHRRGSFQERFGMSGGPHRPLDLTPLGLTEEQKTKIQQMREQSKAKMKDLHKTLIAKQVEIRNLIFSPEATDAQIRLARKNLLQTQTQIDDTNINDLLAIRGLLTPEQKKKLPECKPGAGPNPPEPGMETSQRTGIK